MAGTTPEEMITEILELADDVNWETEFIESLQGQLSDGRDLSINQLASLENQYITVLSRAERKGLR